MYTRILGPPKAVHGVTVAKPEIKTQCYKYATEVESTWARSISKAEVHVFWCLRPSARGANEQ